MKRIIFFALLFIASHAAFSQTATNKEKKVRELLEITGAAKLGVQMSQSLFKDFEKTFSSVPQEFWQKLKAEFKAETLADLVVPVYMKYYTEEELDELIKFYNTPIGKKTIALMPQIMQECMEIGQKWGQEAAKKIFRELDSNGYKRDA